MPGSTATTSRTARKPSRAPKSLDGVAMTLDEFIALPDDGADRWLIDGRVREFSPAEDDGVTKRAFPHGGSSSRFDHFLWAWIHRTKFPAEVSSGEIAIRLRPGDREMECADLVVVPDGVPIKQRGEFAYVDGVPTLVVEVLSYSDRAGAVAEKLKPISTPACQWR